MSTLSPESWTRSEITKLLCLGLNYYKEHVYLQILYWSPISWDSPRWKHMIYHKWWVLSVMILSLYCIQRGSQIEWYTASVHAFVHCHLPPCSLPTTCVEDSGPDRTGGWRRLEKEFSWSLIFFDKKMAQFLNSWCHLSSSQLPSWFYFVFRLPFPAQVSSHV